jgi:hypothetical protein
MSTATRVQLHSATQLPSTTSITPCATASFPPAAPALLRLCRASGRAVSPLDFSLVSRTGSRRASGHCVSLRDYSSSGLHRLYYAYVVHPDATSRCSTSRHSVALALAVCPVIPLCVVTTRLAAAMDILHLRRATGCLDTSHGSSSTTSTTPHVRVPRHVARLVTRLVTPLVVDYFDYAARPGASARRAARHAAHRRLLRLRRASGCLSMSRGSASTTSTTPRVRVPQHVTRLVAPCGSSCRSSSTSTTPRVWVPRHVARLVTRLIVDYFDYAARPGASACHAARRAVRLVVSFVVDFDYATCLGASARRAACRAARHRLLCLHLASGCLSTSRGSSSTTRHLSTRLLVGRSHWPTAGAPTLLLAARLLRAATRLVVRSHWLYFSHAVHHDYLSRGNTDSTSSMPRAIATLSSGRIASTIISTSFPN